DPGDVDLGADVGLVVIGQERQRRGAGAVDAHPQHAGLGDLGRQQSGDRLVGRAADELLRAGGVDPGTAVAAAVGRLGTGVAGGGGRGVGAGGEHSGGQQQPGGGETAAGQRAGGRRRSGRSAERGHEWSSGSGRGRSSGVSGTERGVSSPVRTRCRKERVRSWRGWSRTSPGGPCSTIRPRSMKTTVSATSRAKGISWVTITSVVPARARERITASTSSTSSGSRALVGSSNSSTFGSRARARAIATRCCWPPES